MNILGLTIARTKTLELRAKQASLVPISPSRGWRSWIQEMTTGGWQRNEDVQIDTVLSNPTLFACVTLIASDIAKLRPKLVEQDRNGIWNEVDSAAFSPFLRKPNHYQNWIEFIQWYELSKLTNGNVYVLKARDGRGVVVAGYVLDPARVAVKLSPDGSVFYELTLDPLAGRGAETITVPAREIIHEVMCPLFHPLLGVSPIFAAGWPAMQGLNIRNKSDKFFSNGSRPGGLLIAPGAIDEANAQELKTYWDTNFSGDNIGKIAVLEHGMKYEPLGMTAEQSRLVEQLHMSDEDIAKCFHMPRYKVGVGPDPTYNNIEALTKTYYSDCLQVHIESLELKLDTGLEVVNVPGKTLGIELDRSALFEMDTNAKADAATKAIRAGMSPNEVRFRYYDLGPAKGGDSPMMQHQDYSLEALAERDANQPFAKPAPTVTPPAPELIPPAEDEPEDEEKGMTAGMILTKVAALRQQAAL